MYNSGHYKYADSDELNAQVSGVLYLNLYAELVVVKKSLHMISDS